MKQFSAIDIKQLFYCDTDYLKLPAFSTNKKHINGADIAALLGSFNQETQMFNGDKLSSKYNVTEIKNVHQDTWQVEESEPSQDGYKNQLTGATYRMGTKQMGDVTFNFTIGRYDFETKKALLGGEAQEGAWARQRGITNIRKTMIALCEDNILCVLPNANVLAREANTDGAVGIGVVATMLEPEQEGVSGEYWFDAEDLAQATVDGDTTDHITTVL